MENDPSMGNNGIFGLLYQRKPFKESFLMCIASDGEGWEHVSVSVRNAKRTPTWGEMAFVKLQFWDPEDVVMQIHPAESEYVNNHPYVLHLWRPANGECIPVPSSFMVGIKGLTVSAP
jgi:hypothetical protein